MTGLSNRDAMNNHFSRKKAHQLMLENKTMQNESVYSSACRRAFNYNIPILQQNLFSP